MKKLLLFSFVMCMCLSRVLYGQSISYNIAQDGITPVSPQNYSFTRAAEFPISPYTGTANIVIPLETIRAGGLELPMGLIYNSGGVRVNQESSMVGLNWDFRVGGTIVQTIVDGDDLTTPNRLRPDYYNVPLATEYPYRFQYPYVTDGPTYVPYSAPIPVELQYGGRVSTDYYFQLAGARNYRNYNFFDAHRGNYDSEPDIFTAEFNGHSIKFMLNWNYGEMTVLNNKGYSVTRQGDSIFVIATPQGEFYHFGIKTRTRSSSNGQGIFGVSQSVDITTSNTWRVIKIVLQNKQEINFTYNKTAEVENAPQSSYKWQQPDFPSSRLITGTEYLKGYLALNLNPVNGSYVNITKTYTSDSRVYPTRVVYPGGQVDFVYSDREDMVATKKLDSVKVSSGDTRKYYVMKYSHYDTLSATVDSAEYIAYGAKRLRLDRFIGADSGVTQFFYDTMPFPRKNSFAQDVWGYYNGVMTNKSLVPNPRKHKYPLLPDNGENHAAHREKMKMGSLQKIVYPTGGSATFEYEANTFENVSSLNFVPDFDSSTNTICTGYGMRVKSITYSVGDSSVARKTSYAYYGGKAILPQSFFNFQSVGSIFIGASAGTSEIRSWNVNEATTTDGYSSSPLASVNGVGYDSVVKRQVDSQGRNLGRTTTVFVNNPDRTQRLVGSVQQTMVLPPIKTVGIAQNGSELSVKEYDSTGRLMRSTTNQYNVYVSDYAGDNAYGARVAGMWVLGFYDGIAYPNLPYYAQWLIGFYPVFDFHSKLARTDVREYTSTGDSISYYNTFNYNANGLLSSISKNLSQFNYYDESYVYPNEVTGAIAAAMVAAHRYADRIQVTRTHNGAKMSQTVTSYIGLGGDRFVPSRIADVHFISSSNTGDTSAVYYTLFDTVTCKPLQTKRNGVVTNLLYGYNGEYLVAQAVYSLADPSGIINGHSGIGYTSFEYSGDPAWTLGSSPLSSLDAAAGTKYYHLQSDLSFKGLVPHNEYVMSYWSRSGSYLPSTGRTDIGKTVNGWTYYEHVFSSPNDQVFLVGNGDIDEIRIFPVGAQMETYTHSPLVGATSFSDANGKRTIYQYDRFNRLKTLRDDNRNVMLHYTYSFKGRYKNTVRSQNFAKNNCSSGYKADSLSYVVPAGTYWSNLSQAEADAKALADIAQNGQAYVNKYGTCTYIPPLCGPGYKWIDGACREGQIKYVSSTYGYYEGIWQYMCEYVHYYPYNATTEDFGEYIYSSTSCPIANP